MKNIDIVIDGFNGDTHHLVAGVSKAGREFLSRFYSRVELSGEARGDERKALIPTADAKLLDKLISICSPELNVQMPAYVYGA